jgi:hypothetical protein
MAKLPKSRGTAESAESAEGAEGRQVLTPELAKRIKAITEGRLEGRDLFLLLDVRAQTGSQSDQTGGVVRPSDEVMVEFRTVNSAFERKPSEVTLVYHHDVAGAKARELVKKAAVILSGIKGDIGLTDETPISISFSETGGIRASKLASMENGAPFPEVVKPKQVIGELTGGILPTLKQLSRLNTKTY